MNIKFFKDNFNTIVGGLKRKRIVVLYGGFSEEREASIYSGEKVSSELIKNRFSVIKVDPARKNLFKLLKPSKDVVFNCLHGEFGESGHVSAIMDYLKVPYTFSDVYTSSVTMDKLFFKAVIRKLGFTSPIDEHDVDFNIARRYFIHKKIRGGGSIDMRVDGVKKSKPKYFTEHFLNGRILTMGVLEYKKNYVPLGIVEVKVKGRLFYDKEAKYEEGFASYVIYNGGNESKIVQSVIKIFQFLNVKCCGRIDLIEHDGKLYFLEINSVPGLYSDSNLAFSAKLKDLSFYELLIWILNSASYIYL